MATKTAAPGKDHITLKWGSLKAWHVHSQKCLDILQRWSDLGVSMSAMAHHDTPEQKQLICDLIDECNAKTILLEWEGKRVSKAKAKKYILEYGTDKDD